MLLPGVCCLWCGEEGALPAKAYDIWGNKHLNSYGFAAAESICGDGAVCEQTLQLGQILLPSDAMHVP